MARKLQLDVETSGSAEAAAALKLVARAEDDVGDQAEQSKRRVEALGRAIEATAAKSKLLRAAFVDSGQEKFNKDLKISESALSRLTKLQADLRKELEQPSKKGGFLKSIIGEGGLAGLATDPAILSAAAPVGVVVASAISATLTAALVAGGGLAGIGAGIALQAKDPAVEAAYKDLSATVGNDLKDASLPFRGELIQTSHIFADEFAKELPGIKGMFAELAPLTTGLAEGVAGGVSGLLHGLEGIAKRGGPVIRELSHDVQGIGEAAGSFLDEVSKGSPGGAAALHDISRTLEDTLRTAGPLVHNLTDIYQILSKINQVNVGSGLLEVFSHPKAGAFLTGPWAALGAQLLGTSDAADQSADAASQAAAAYDAAAEAAQRQAQSMTDLDAELKRLVSTEDQVAGKMVGEIFSATMAVDQATLQWHESLTQVTDSITRHNHSLDENTAKGQANVGAILQAVSANMQQYQSQIAVGVSAEDAAAAYDRNTEALERQLRKAGLTQSAIDGLIGKYAGVPDQVNTDIATRGLSEAIGGLDDLIRRLNGLPARKDITIEYHVVGLSGSLHHDFAQGGVRRAAVGMIIPPSDPGTVLAAEPQTGGEVLTPLRGISRNRAMALTQTVGNAYGFNVVPRSGGGRTAWGAARSAPSVVRLDFTGDRAIVELIKSLVTVHGGGDVQVAFGN